MPILDLVKSRRGLWIGALIVGPALSWASQNFFFAELLVSLRVQIGIGLLMLTLLGWRNRLLRDYGLGGLVATCLILASANFRQIQTTPEDRKQSEADKNQSARCRLAMLNVRSSNRNGAAVQGWIQKNDPDVLVCLETDSWWTNELNRIMSTHPYRMLHPADAGNFGICLYSRLPATDLQMVTLSHDSTPSISAKIDIHGEQVQLLAIHPIPPINANQFAQRNRQLASAVDWAKSRKASNGSHAWIVGDFNLTPWSPWFTPFSDIGLRRVSNSWWPSSTWYLKPEFAVASLVIDHILVDSQWRVTEFSTSEHLGSDHRGLVAELILQ
ncbi:MAG: endonuclease/exonuclease/phosphatase family protein [Planctomycetota bacterium]